VKQLNVRLSAFVKGFHERRQYSPVLERGWGSIVSLPFGLPGPSGAGWRVWGSSAVP